ncbi:hypothetical protein BUZ15_14830, partial [Staphylococcus gallinarum]|uniref:hypothetical protein n=1 Tax=Staphylococcus gallinarum TaxID=1293 RepID=UPI000D464135
HAKDVTKISNFQRDNLRPTKEVGYDKGKSRADGGWYIHFPDIFVTVVTFFHYLTTSHFN